MAEAALLHNEEEETDSDSSDTSSQQLVDTASQKAKWADYQDSHDPFEIWIQKCNNL